MSERFLGDVATFGENCLGDVWDGCLDPHKGYKSLHIAVMTYATLVNTHTDRQTRQTAFDCLRAQLAELEIIHTFQSCYKIVTSETVKMSLAHASRT